MKKLLCACLSVILLLGLCLPASAVEDFDPPLWEEYGYSSMQEMLTDWGMTAEDYDLMVEEERIARNWHYDEATGDFDPPLWEYYGYSSKDEMLTDWEMTENEYYELVEEERLWKEQENWTDEQWDAYFAQQLQSEKNALGLVYDINVMLRNQPFAFTDAEPEIVNDRVMVPLRAVMENMGAQVEYDDAERTATITDGDKSLKFVLGSDKFTCTENGEESVIELDSVPYIKNGRVFVPVRYAAEALGCEALWDNEYRTAVLMDREDIVSEINENFTIANKVLAMDAGLDLTKNYKTSANMDVKVTAFDSINGDKTYTGGMDVTVLQNSKSAKMTLKFDVQAVMDVLKAIAEKNHSEEDEYFLEAMELLKVLNDDSMELILDLDGGMAYARSKLLPYFMMDEYGVEFDAENWISMDIGELLGELDLSELMAAGGTATVGDLIYEVYAGEWSAIYAYDSMITSQDLNGFDDSNFTKRGGNYYFTQELGDPLDAGSYNTTEGSLNAEIVMNGDKASRIRGDMNMSTDSSLFAMEMKLKFDVGNMDGTMSGSIHVKNTILAEFSMSVKSERTSAQVPSAPPAGDNVVSAESLMESAAE
ncbi:MAG: copper amine oxidase N-terminal domain-containing protein [Candidatus Heteroscillospira sp.]|jgi:hypothetical protein